MDELGRIAILVDREGNYHKYYMLNDEEVFKTDGESIQKNPYWDIDILSEDLESDYKIYYLDCDIARSYLQEKEDIKAKKVMTWLGADEKELEEVKK